MHLVLAEEKRAASHRLQVPEKVDKLPGSSYPRKPLHVVLSSRGDS